MEQANPLISRLAAAVEEALTVRGITLREASDATGIPTTTLHRRIKAISPFSVTELASLAALIETTPADLLIQATRRSPASVGTSDHSPESASTDGMAAGRSTERTIA